MRVLATGDAVGGVWTYALELADALEPHGVELHLATMGQRPDAAQRAEARRSAVAGLHESDFALEWEPDPWADVDAAGEWLLELAAELRPDLVHLNGYAHAGLDWAAPVVVVAHSDVVSWWRAVKGDPAPDWLDEYRRRVAAGLEAADAVCAPTRAVLDDLRRSFGFEGPGWVVPNGRRAVASPAAKEPLVAGLGRFWDEAKNVAALQRVASRIAWPVELAGPGTPRGRIAPEEARALLARAAVFASPARYEPFGLTALEAAQAGCALVLGDIPSLREVWGDAAAYVPPDDDDALADALDTLAGDETRLGDLARRARERASPYTPAVTASTMLALYRRVLLPAGAAA
jgi:glycosyltransferase involved in cell wall biosynthesis